MQSTGIEVLEVTTPDKQDRRKRGQNDALDAQNAAHAAFAGKRTLMPKPRDRVPPRPQGLPKDSARRITLPMIHNTIVCAPDEVRETL